MLQKLKRAIEAYRTETKYVMRENVDGALVPVEVSLGDGKAEFIGEGTEAEFLEQEQEDKGNKSWLDRLKRL